MKRKNLTQKQTLFAFVYIEARNASEAYRQSYDVGEMTRHSIACEASAMLRHPAVSAKIDELCAEHREAHGVTVDTLAREYDDIARHAVDLGKIAAAVSAVTGKAKLYGLAIDNQKVSGSIEFTPPVIEFSAEVVEHEPATTT